MKFSDEMQYTLSDIIKCDLDWKAEIRINTLDDFSESLIPEDLTEAKYVLCMAQKYLEAVDEKFKWNRPIVKKALLTSTLWQFAKVVLDDFEGEGDPNGDHLDGLYGFLRNVGIIDDNYNVIPYSA